MIKIIDAKKILKSLKKTDSDAISANNEEKNVDDNEKISADVSKVKVVPSAKVETSAGKIEENSEAQNIFDSPADDVTIFTTTPAQIEYWHACVNIHIGNLLAQYDLNVGTRAFDAFKIGVAEENHAATFALDDTHYLKFSLNDTNVRPIDKEQAEKVLRKVNALRFDKLKNFNRYTNSKTVRVLLESDED